MSNSLIAHWGAALIGGVCFIVGTLSGSTYQHYQNERDLAKIEASRSDLMQQINDQAQQLRGLTIKLNEQQGLIEALRGKLSDDGRGSEAALGSAPQRRSDSQSVAEGGHTSQSMSEEQSSGGLLVVLKGCTLTGSNVGCEFRVTNKREDRQISLLAVGPMGPPGFPSPTPSRIVTQDGSESQARAVGLGTDQWETWQSHCVLPKDVPMRAQLWFENVPQDSTSLALVQLTFQEGRAEFDVKFNDIPLEK